MTVGGTGITQGCRKKRYRDKLSADLELMACERRSERKLKRQERRAYKCPRCKGWHLTSEPARV